MAHNETHFYSYALGIFFSVLVAVIWASSSVLVQFLYNAHAFESPFLLTYIGVSMFTWPLPVKYITDRLIQPCFQASLSQCSEIAAEVAQLDDCNIYNAFDNQENKAAHSSQTGRPVIRRRAPMGHRDDLPALANTVTAAPGVYENGNLDEEGDSLVLHDPKAPANGAAGWTRLQHMQAAAQIAPVWFIANWSYNASLALTSIASSTVMISTCSLFAFMFAILAKDEGFQCSKLSGVMLGIAGTALTAFHDSRDQSCYNKCHYALLGDLCAALSAVCFGLYAVQIRLLCPRNEELYNMQRLLGYVGLINMVVLSPIAIWKLFGNVGLTLVVFGLIIVRGLLDYVLSEYLYFRAVVLTNATVATMGLGLTIPLAFLADCFLGKSHVITPWSLFGAMAVMLGFLLVNTDGGKELDEELLNSMKKEEEQRQKERLQLCHPLPCGCLLDGWMWTEDRFPSPPNCCVEDNSLAETVPPPEASNLKS